MKISDVSKKTGLSNSTLRFYENQKLIRNISKDKQGIRNYTENDIKWIKFLASIKNANLSLSEMMSYAELYYNKNESFVDRLELTIQCREKLENEMNQLKQGMEFLDCKIQYYKEKIKVGILFDDE